MSDLARLVSSTRKSMLPRELVEKSVGRLRAARSHVVQTTAYPIDRLFVVTAFHSRYSASASSRAEAVSFPRRRAKSSRWAKRSAETGTSIHPTYGRLEAVSIEGPKSLNLVGDRLAPRSVPVRTSGRAGVWPDGCEGRRLRLAVRTNGGHR